MKIFFITLVIFTIILSFGQVNGDFEKILSKFKVKSSNVGLGKLNDENRNFLQTKGGKSIGQLTPERFMIFTILMKAGIYAYMLISDDNYILKNLVIGRNATEVELFFMRIVGLYVNTVGIALWYLKDEIGTSKALKLECLSHLLRLPFILQKYLKGGKFFVTPYPLFVHIIFPLMCYYFSA